MKEAANRGGLFVVRAKYLTSLWMNYVNASAGRARHDLIGHILIGRIVGSKALDV